MTFQHVGLVAITGISITIAVFFNRALRRKTSPPQLYDPIPFVFNSLQFIFNNAHFMSRTSELFGKTNVAQFYMILTPVFLLSGKQNIQTLFARSAAIGNETSWLRVALPGVFNMRPQDIRRFRNDKSGRDRQALPGNEDMPLESRYWYGFHLVHSEHLSKPQYYRSLARRYRDLLSESLEQEFPVDSWQKLSLIDFCQTQVARTSIDMLFGRELLELSPGLLEAYWTFDEQMMAVSLLPRWLAKGGRLAQARYHSMLRVYRDNVSKSGTDENEKLVPMKIIDWMTSHEFHEDSIDGTLGALIFALISNTVPITIWTLFEIISDPSLLHAIRKEVDNAYVYDATTATCELDIERLVTLPLLQSTFTEVLRLHMSFNVLRNARTSFEMDGFAVQEGDMLTAPMQVAHYSEQVWGVAHHPAHEFWAERHIHCRDTDKPVGIVSLENEMTFSLEGRSSSFFPFGGGSSICPGRHLAKSEVLTTVALIVSKMDIEFEGWTSTDGKPSCRRAYNNSKYSGIGAMFPDRDLQCRWRRCR